MQDFISEIYNYAQIIPCLKEIQEEAYANSPHRLMVKWGQIQALLGEFCEETEKRCDGAGRALYGEIQKNCRLVQRGKEDIILFADSLDIVIDKAYVAISKWGKIDVADNNYRIFTSRSGFLSLQRLSDNRHLHSMIDPMTEGRIAARELYDERYLAYKFLGCGLGYLPLQIFNISDCSADIYIYHNDETLVQYALDYGVLSWIPEDKLHIYVNNDEIELLDKYSDDIEGAGAVMDYILDDVRDVLSETGKKIVSYTAMNNRTRRDFKDINCINFNRNIFNVKETFKALDDEKTNSEWIVVAAGPSLNLYMNRLKTEREGKTLICVEPVLKKLIDNGIFPDFCCVVDPQSHTYNAFKELRYDGTTLLMAVTANWRFGELYTGEKYLVPGLQEKEVPGVTEKFKDEFIEHGMNVATSAVSIAINMGAKKINLVGLDLAYPGNKTHADGVINSTEVNDLGMIKVEDVNGEEVHSTEQFANYVMNLEMLLSKYPEVEIINQSPNGAKIKGTEKRTWV